jgi:hypothetical protein
MSLKVGAKDLIGQVKAEANGLEIARWAIIDRMSRCEMHILQWVSCWLSRLSRLSTDIG